MRLSFVVVAVVGLLVGCTAEAVESPGPEVSTTMPSESPSVSESARVSPTPSPSPTPAESFPGKLPTEDAASSALIAGWQDYLRVLEKYSADPMGFTDFTETQNVTTGNEKVIILDLLSAYREEKVRVIGNFAFRDVEIGTIQLNAEGLRQATLEYCVDRSNMEVVSYEGTQQDTSGLTPTYPETTTLVEGADGVWRVAQVRNDQERTC
ncbi:hypothetical protein ACFQ06_04265 [Tessaracoccus lubricantis]|uniref:hypothetical protein n=1 Tax=Tessaracoccus lubricantis TaxID=545543 RepID=UPI0036438200